MTQSNCGGDGCGCVCLHMQLAGQRNVASCGLWMDTAYPQRYCVSGCRRCCQAASCTLQRQPWCQTDPAPATAGGQPLLGPSCQSARLCRALTRAHRAGQVLPAGRHGIGPRATAVTGGIRCMAWIHGCAAGAGVQLQTVILHAGRLACVKSV
jgi:hypothetical protein